MFDCTVLRKPNPAEVWHLADRTRDVHVLAGTSTLIDPPGTHEPSEIERRKAMAQRVTDIGRPVRSLTGGLGLGIVAGLIGAMAMAAYAMVAHLTYKGAGFFTPCTTSPPPSLIP